MRYTILFLLPALLSCGHAKVKDVTIEGKKTRPIAGLTPSNVHDQLTKKGFKLEKSTNAELETWTSVESNEMHEFKVITTATTTGKVLSVQGSIFSMLTFDQSAKDFVGDLAALSYKYADPQKAKAWAASNLEKGGSTVIGDVNFQITAQGETSRVLKIFVE